MAKERRDIDPRIARTREVVLEAAAEIVKERGYGGATIEAVSERCGVARSTIYRHWPERAELVFDAMKSNVIPSPMPDTGNVRDDLLEIVTGIVTWLSDETSRMVVLSMIVAASREPKLAELHSSATRERRALIELVLTRGIERGELRGDIDTTESVTEIVSPLFYRLFITHEHVDATYAEERVDRWLATARVGSDL